MPRLLADLTPLREHRNFRNLWLGQAVSNVGNQMTVVGVSYQAYRITGSTFMVGLIGLVQLAPTLLGSMLGGAAADAVDRRRVLIGSQIAMAAASVGLVLNTVLGRPNIVWLFVCVAANAAFVQVNNPARSAIIASIVPKEQLASAAGLSSIMSQSALILGPAVAGVLITAVGLKSLYAIDAISYGAVLLASFSLPSLAPTGGGTPFGLKSVSEGLRYARGHRFLVSLVVLDMSSMIFGMPKAVFPALALHVYHGGAGTVGVLYSAPGIGALVASLLSGWAGHVRYRGRAVVWCMVAWGVAITLLGIVPVLGVGILMLAVAGGADVLGVVLRTASFQSTVPSRLLGRLNAVFFGSAVSANSLGAGEAGVAASIGGTNFAVWSGGVLCLAGILVCLWRFPELRRVTGYDVVEFDEDTGLVLGGLTPSSSLPAGPAPG